MQAIQMLISEQGFCAEVFKTQHRAKVQCTIGWVCERLILKVEKVIDWNYFETGENPAEKKKQKKS